MQEPATPTCSHPMTAAPLFQVIDPETKETERWTKDQAGCGVAAQGPDRVLGREWQEDADGAPVDGSNRIPHSDGNPHAHMGPSGWPTAHAEWREEQEAFLREGGMCGRVFQRSTFC